MEVHQWLRACGRYKKERVIRKLYRRGIFTQKTLPEMFSVSVANEDIEMYNKVVEVWNDIFGFRPLSVDYRFNETDTLISAVAQHDETGIMP